MVFENPVIDSRALAHAVDPSRPEEETYDSLLNKRLVSAGVPLRTGDGPGLLLHCTLNRDAAYAARHGDRESAVRLLDHAVRIERDLLAPWLRALPRSKPIMRLWGVAHDADPAELERRRSAAWIEDVMFDAHGDGRAIAPSALEAAQAVAEVRDGLDATSMVPKVMIGRIWLIGDTFTDIRIEDPTTPPFTVLTSTIFGQGMKLGDPVVVRLEPDDVVSFRTSVERALEDRVHLDRLTGRPETPHLDALLDEAQPPTRQRWVRPLRRLA